MQLFIILYALNPSDCMHETYQLMYSTLTNASYYVTKSKLLLGHISCVQCIRCELLLKILHMEWSVCLGEAIEMLFEG